MPLEIVNIGNQESTGTQFAVVKHDNSSFVPQRHMIVITDEGEWSF